MLKYVRDIVFLYPLLPLQQASEGKVERIWKVNPLNLIF